MTTTEQLSDKIQLKLLTVMSYYNQGHTIHEACKLASVPLHSYYRWRKMSSAQNVGDVIPNELELKNLDDSHATKSSNHE